MIALNFASPFNQFIKKHPMKAPIKKTKTVYPLFILALFFIFSCSKEDPIPEPIDEVYLSIPDPHFETLSLIHI